MGTLGFLVDVEPVDALETIKRLLSGFVVDERSRLKLLLNGVCMPRATNEIAFLTASPAKMIEFEILVDGSLMEDFRADGVIIATATGSTAYAMSAGGPIVDPRLRAMILTAMQPHTLSARPLVLGPESSVMLTVTTAGDAVLSADSQIRLHMLSGDALRVTQSPRVTRLFCVDSHDFLVKLGERLFWSQSLVGNWQP